MKYVVDVDGARHEVDVEGELARIASRDGVASLGPPTTPVRMLRIGDRVVRVQAVRGESRGAYAIDIDGHRYNVDAVDERTRAIRDMTAKSGAAAGPAPLKAPMPGLIVRVHVSVGDRVETGQGLVVMEAMKMENELRATAPGVVKGVKVEVGTAVEKGTVLIEME